MKIKGVRPKLPKAQHTLTLGFAPEVVGRLLDSGNS